MNEKYDIIDFHAHILPGADHGSRDPETSKKQLALLRDAGVKSVVATPHFYPQNDRVDTFLERRARAADLLTAEGAPRVYLGAEVLVCPGIDHMPELERLCIEGTDVLLLEMPFSGWREEHIEAVRKISRKGMTVVMAHIDRYPEKDIARLSAECDVLYQINGETQLTFKGRRKADKLVASLPVVAVGSDLHGNDKKAVKNLVRLAQRLQNSGVDVCETTCALLEKVK